MPTLTFAVNGTGTGVRQDIDVVGSGHVVKSDAYESFGGRDEYPSPLAYLLAALTSCTQVVASVVSQQQGITIESYDIAVEGDFDPTVLTTGATADAEHPGTFHTVRLTVGVVTDASQEQVEQLGAEVERRCPVGVLFAQAGTTVTSTWTAKAAASV